MLANYAKKLILTASLALVPYINCSDLQVRHSLHHGHMRNFNPNITVGIGAENRYRNVSKNMVEESLDSLTREAIRNDMWVYLHNTLTEVSIWDDSAQVILNEGKIRSAFRKAHKNDTIAFYRIRPDPQFGAHFGPPTPGDLIELIERKPEYTGDYTNKDLKLVGRLFDGFGMWEYDIDTTLVNKARKNPDEFYKIFDEIFKENLLQNDLYKKSQQQYESEQRYGLSSRPPQGPPTEPSSKPQKPRHSSPPRFQGPHKPPVFDKNSVDNYIEAMKKHGVILKFTPSKEL